MKIKIEINVQDSFTELGFQDIEFESLINWTDGEWHDNGEKAFVKTYCLNEILATKLHMLCEPGRQKGRDLFDLWYGMNYLKDQTDPEKIIRCFHAHVKNRGSEVSREKFLVELEIRMTRLLGTPENLNH